MNCNSIQVSQPFGNNNFLHFKFSEFVSQVCDLSLSGHSWLSFDLWNRLLHLSRCVLWQIDWSLCRWHVHVVRFGCSLCNNFLLLLGYRLVFYFVSLKFFFQHGLRKQGRTRQRNGNTNLWCYFGVRIRSSQIFVVHSLSLFCHSRLSSCRILFEFHRVSCWCSAVRRLSVTFISHVFQRMRSD